MSLLLVTHPTWMEMDYAALAVNLGALRRRLAPGVRVIASVKANAYGHGVIEVVRRLVDLGLDMVATGAFRDAVALRRAGFDLDILMLGATLPEGIPALLAQRLTPTIHTVELAEAVSRAAQEPVAVYVKVDCGHGRLGFPVAGALAPIEAIARLPNVRVEGIYTHLPFADARGQAWARNGLDRFEALLKVLADNGLEVPVSQARASAAIIAGLDDALSAVCPGGLLYGKSPLDDEFGGAAEFRPVLAAVRTRLIHISSDVSASRHKHRLRGGGPTGVVPFGRCDGHRPALQGSAGRTLLRGQPIPILGISLEHAVLELSGIDRPRIGEIVTILGNDGDARITLDDIAGWQGVTGSDVLMGLDGRMPRIDVSNGSV
jgi:alanine racemase